MEVKDCKVQLQGTIYIDSVFLLNLVMDLYLLALVSKVLGNAATYPGILLGSAVGAAGYCIILCLPGTYMLKILFGMIPVGALMIKIVFKTQGLKELLQAEGWLFTFSFFLGGFIIFLKGKIPVTADKSNRWTLLAGLGFAGFALGKKILEVCKDRRRNHFCKVKLPGDEGIVEVSALIDTGNGLTEPVSHKPVAILEEEAWEHLRRWMRPEKFKVIPYHSIGKDNGILEGYEIDTIKVKGNECEKQYDKVIVAVFKGKVSKGGSYQMILPPEL